MTIETYFTMNARIVAILRQGSDPMVLYAAQRIEELERIAGIRGKCLELAMETLRKLWWRYDASKDCWRIAESAMVEIKQRLAELEHWSKGT